MCGDIHTRIRSQQLERKCDDGRSKMKDKMYTRKHLLKKTFCKKKRELENRTRTNLSESPPSLFFPSSIQTHF